ncbi:hypothetical protein BSKO_01573 [Bryopsis sp. KO-2023]|nr:hypothetical protein BSKO_01573 [Bryopsis sp. KO-2023]
MSVFGLWRGRTLLARSPVGRRGFAEGDATRGRAAVRVAARRQSFIPTLPSGARGCSVLSCATRDDSFFFKPSRGGEHMESATPQNSELVRVVAGLEISDKGRILAAVSSEAKKAIATTVANTFGFVTDKDLQVTVRGPYFPLYAILLSCLCAGYSLRATEARMQLEGFLKPTPPTVRDDDDYVGKSSRLSREVRAKLPSEVAGYIASLEAKIEMHETAVTREKAKTASANPLTDYVLNLGPGKILRMTASSSLEVTGAFNSVAGRQMEKFGAPPLNLAGLEGETQKVKVNRKAFVDAVEWCLLAGYFIRCEEYRISLDKCYSKEDAEKNTDESPSWVGKIGGFLGRVFLGDGNQSHRFCECKNWWLEAMSDTQAHLEEDQ